VRDARDHGVVVLPPDVNRSAWDCTLEELPLGPRAPLPASESSKQEDADKDVRGPIKRSLALRLGFRQITGAAEAEMKKLVERRGAGYHDVADLWRRGGLSRRQIEVLSRADAFGSLALSRRDALWSARALHDEQLPLFDPGPRASLPASSSLDIPDADKDVRGPEDMEPTVTLPAMRLGEQVVDDYHSLRMSLRRHPMALLRPHLDPAIAPSRDLAILPLQRPASVAGLVLVRQRPGTASGTVFITLEDETGIANAIVWSHVFERYRLTIMGARLLRIDGRLQREGKPEEGQVIHIVAEHFTDCSHLLDTLTALDGDSPPGPDTTASPYLPFLALPERRRRDSSTHTPPRIEPRPAQTEFVVPVSHADEARGGSMDNREKLGLLPHRPRIPVQSRDFH
jgi:DNA polymerase-3 subunit alpha/error-prone DNA polymerase